MQLTTVDGFAMDHPVSVVEHGGRERNPFRHFAADRTEIVHDRIRRLLEIGDVGRYDLWGLNCEHVATWCMTGIADSVHVRRRWFASSAVVGGVVTLLVANYVRNRQTLPSSAIIAIASFYGLRMIPVILSHYGAWAFTSLVERERPAPAWYSADTEA